MGTHSEVCESEKLNDLLMMPELVSGEGGTQKQN